MVTRYHKSLSIGFWLVIGGVASLCILLILAVILLTAMFGGGDIATAASSPQALSMKSLPAGLPPVISPARPSEDAAPLYEKAFEAYLIEDSVAFKKSPEKRANIADLLIEAMDAGQVPQGWLDDQMPLKPGNPEPQFKDALEGVYQQAMLHGTDIYESDPKRAEQVAKAVWALGQRMYEKNVRLYPRYQGLEFMDGAADGLNVWSQSNAGDAWRQPIRDQVSKMKDKLSIIKLLHPNMADLTAIATKDKDPTYRVEAMLRLGSLKFAPGGKPNQRMVQGAISRGKKDSHPMVAQAAEAAEAFTIEEQRRTR